ncbi:MAG: M48 family metalloprotease [Chloroflexi bacterium]|nr:M48 family metalloprotease [Chloroflexota bacterium]
MWEQIRANRIKSVILVVAMGALLLALGYFLGLLFFDSETAGLAIALVGWAFMSLIAYFQGGSILLSVSGARKINKEDHPRLYNIVEEMKIASGLARMPDIYIIDDPALNAFATGRDENHASVAITSGLLQKLNRDELQGVIGHEMSHIKNRDVLLMSLLSVLLGTIVILAYYASRMLFYGGAGSRGGRRGGSQGGGGQIIILVVALVFMILAPIAAQLIYFAVSRKREYLADASSALYTRYPAGLASALEKLATSNTHVSTANKATAPMYISNPLQKKGASIESLTATHPPIAERVRILRAMGGASMVDYERAYEKVKGRTGPVPASALAGAGAVGLRPASAEALQPGLGESEIERARETSDLMWRMNRYHTITCSGCGTKLRLPPSYDEDSVRCPHCGTVNPV